MNWYRNKGNESDIVLSTRVRLARNIAGYPFPVRLDSDSRKEICDSVADILDGEELKRASMASLTPAQTVSLAERHLISPEFACENEGGELLLSDEEDISIMLCEEDHIRIQVIYPGLCLEETYKEADRLDKILEEKLDYAFSDKLGYLTQCPTNLGTAMRASVMLHLPALSKKGAIRALSSTVAKLGLTLRGIYGAGSEVSGDIYQLSNQVTLGISEESAIKNLSSIAMQIISQENQARCSLIKDEDYIDSIYRALGILRSAYKLTSKELITLISLVRLGACEGIVEAPTQKLTELMIVLQSATLNAESEEPLSPSQADILRARRVREALN